MAVIGPSTGPFVFSALLAIFSPAIRRFVRKDVRSSLETLKEKEHISVDGPDYVIPIIRRAVGTVQMITALLITIVSGGLRLQQSIGTGRMAVTWNLLLVSASLLLFGYFYASNPYEFDKGVNVPLIPVRIQRAPVFVVIINAAYFGSICVT